MTRFQETHENILTYFKNSQPEVFLNLTNHYYRTYKFTKTEVGAFTKYFSGRLFEDFCCLERINRRLKG